MSGYARPTRVNKTLISRIDYMRAFPDFRPRVHSFEVSSYPLDLQQRLIVLPDVEEETQRRCKFHRCGMVLNENQTQGYCESHKYMWEPIFFAE
jgi:hypothetical protein